jgi:hypothetical protein
VAGRQFFNLRTKMRIGEITMNKLSEFTPVGWLCRIKDGHGRHLAASFVQQFAEIHFGEQLSQNELQALHPKLRTIDDTDALYEAITQVKGGH